MPTARKVEIVEELTERLQRATGVLASEYRGLSVKDMTALRRQLRDNGIEIHVVKNTLLRRAAENAGCPAVADLAEGPTALVLTDGDVVQMVKTVVDYQRTARNAFAARKAFIDGMVVAGDRLTEIATLPPKEQMIAEIAGALQSPIANLVGLLQATLQEFTGLLDARAEQIASAA